MSAGAPYAGLTPEVILDALASVGTEGDGRLLALPSYENRVWLVYREDAPAVVAKFYRPTRWSDVQIAEEHAFVAELAEREIPVVAPIALDAAGATLATFAGLRFSVYPRAGGRDPPLDDPGTLTRIGRYLARIHTVGAAASFAHRPSLDAESFGDAPRAFLLASGMIPDELRTVYEGVSAQAIAAVRHAIARAGAIATLRVHGDCHRGNILWTDAGPHFVDFDDARSAPAVQDLWMLLPGDRDDATRAMIAILEGYESIAEFDRRELALVEPLRTLRLIHYAGWIAARWEDPAFPAAFPWFGTTRYWQDRILELREQIAAIDEPALEVE